MQSSCAFEHQLVDRALRARELAADRKRARDVGRVAVELAAGVDQQQIRGLGLPVVVAIMEHAGIGPRGHDRGVGDRLRAGAQEFVGELGLDLVFEPSGTRALHGAPMRAARDLGGAAQAAKLVLVLVEPHRRQRRARVDDGLGRGDSGAHAIAHLVEALRDRLVPVRVETHGRVHGTAVAGQLREFVR